MATFLSVHALATPGWTLPDRVTVSGDRYTVGDVLGPGAHTVLQDNVLSQPLGLSPALGQPLRLSGRLLVARLKSQTGQDLVAQHRLKVPDLVVVRREGQSVDAEQLLQALMGEASAFAQAHPGARITPRREMAPLLVPAGRLSLAVPSARQPMVSVLVEDREVARVNLGLTHDIEAPTLVSTRPLAKGHTLTEADVSTLWVPHAKATGGSLDMDSLLGREMTRALAAGQPLSITMTRPTPLVHRGDVVKVLAQSGALVISLTGEALSEGALGETVRVRNRSLGRVFTAVVQDKSLVQVHRTKAGGSVQ